MKESSSNTILEQALRALTELRLDDAEKGFRKVISAESNTRSSQICARAYIALGLTIACKMDCQEDLLESRYYFFCSGLYSGNPDAFLLAARTSKLIPPSELFQPRGQTLDCYDNAIAVLSRNGFMDKIKRFFSKDAMSDEERNERLKQIMQEREKFLAEFDEASDALE